MVAPGVGIGRRTTTVEQLRLEALFGAARAFDAAAPGLVTVRGSAAGYVHVPAVARVPNDVDMYWNGDLAGLRRVVDAVCHRQSSPRFELVKMAQLDVGDQRVDVLSRVHLAAMRRDHEVTHMFWVDVAIPRRIQPTRRLRLQLNRGPAYELGVTPRFPLIAEKFWIYVQSVSLLRRDYRWKDMYDLLALTLADTRAGRVAGPRLLAACQRYFIERARPFPPDIASAPPAWRSAWSLQAGPVVRFAPTLERASELIREYFDPLLRDARRLGP